MKKSRLLWSALTVVALEIVILGVFLFYTAQQQAKRVIHPTAQLSSERLSGEQFAALHAEVKDIIDTHDPHVALTMLKEKMDKDPLVMASCHELMHDIGQLSYQKYRDFAQAMTYREDLCVSGYAHGVIEAHFLANKNALADLPQLCDEYPANKYLRWSCVHGIGHGLMYYTSNDVPTSLKHCRSLSEIFDQQSCANGVFMENFNADGQMHLSNFVSFDDPFQACRIDKTFADECFVYAPVYYLKHTNDYEGVFVWCDSAPVLYKNSCYQGIGNEALKRNFSNRKKVEELCTKAGGAKQTSCIAGMSFWYLEYTMSLSQTKTMCDSLQPDNKSACQLTVTTNTSLF